MMKVEYTDSVELAAPAGAVWHVVTDVARLPDVLSGMTSLVIEGDDPALRVGLAWTQTRVIAGRSGSERLVITALDDGRRYVTTGGGHGIEYVSTWAVEPIGPERSRLTCTFAGIPHGVIARLALRLFGGMGARATRDAMRTDLRDIAAVVEENPR
jgi:carbon monoxide dehydrogenase subunit G